MSPSPESEFDDRDTRAVYASLSMNPKGTPKMDALRKVMTRFEDAAEKAERDAATYRRHLAAARSMFDQEAAR